ncbi:hypothetical protein CW304_18150 [Bacillus sp. UFRGS-B20]|nr:hypothetical protein CW304_18150 [Bacillus sp. UFRGS-B20]
MYIQDAAPLFMFPISIHNTLQRKVKSFPFPQSSNGSLFTNSDKIKLMKNIIKDGCHGLIMLESKYTYCKFPFFNPSSTFKK